jgi:hypothetical protein
MLTSRLLRLLTVVGLLALGCCDWLVGVDRESNAEPRSKSEGTVLRTGTSFDYN